MKMLLAIAPAVILMVYGQLVTKWRVHSMVAASDGSQTFLARAMGYLLDPYVLTAYVTTFAASVAWMFVVERYPISTAFPIYIGLTVVMVTAGGALLLGETMTGWQVLSIVLILAGVAVGSRT